MPTTSRLKKVKVGVNKKPMARADRNSRMKSIQFQSPSQYKWSRSTQSTPLLPDGHPTKPATAYITMRTVGNNPRILVRLLEKLSREEYEVKL